MKKIEDINENLEIMKKMNEENLHQKNIINMMLSTVQSMRSRR